MTFNKKVVLTFVRHYIPGYKSGGPIRSIANTVEHLGDQIHFSIVTSDRDALDRKPYPNIWPDKWNKVGTAQVYYLSPRDKNIFTLARVINNTQYNSLYLNSFFDLNFTIKPLLLRKLKLIPDKPVIIAPRGEFSEGAISLKAWKKKLYVKIAQVAGLYKGITWQASSEHEAQDIKRVMGKVAKDIKVATNLPPPVIKESSALYKTSDSETKIIFLSRITPKKNLDYALRIMAHLKEDIKFNIYGPIRDKNYWGSCKKIIDRLPENISVTFHGELEPSMVPAVMAENDLFFLPTRGENYGHVIAEALAAGTPVLIANTTPWRNLAEAGVGWDLDLSDETSFIQCIEKCAKMKGNDYLNWRRKVMDYAQKNLNNPDLIETNLKLFLEADRK